MGMMYIHHPDIVKFLHAKQDLTQFTNYNISVKITDEWMEASWPTRTHRTPFETADGPGILHPARSRRAEVRHQLADSSDQ